MTSDVCFVDVLDAAILTILLARRRLLLFCDIEKHLPGHKCSTGDVKQHYLINQVNSLSLCIQGGTENNFDDWCLKNDMHIHLKKTCCMTIGTRQTLMQIDSLDILLIDEHIKTVDSQKTLGNHN